MGRQCAALRITCAMILSGAMFWAETARAADPINTSYNPVIQLKAWNTKVDVYHTDPHQCTGSDGQRYHLAVDQTNHLSFLLAAFLSGKAVSLAYTCNSTTGFPDVSGVRLGG